MVGVVGVDVVDACRRCLQASTTLGVKASTRDLKSSSSILSYGSNVCTYMAVSLFGINC